MNRRSSMRPGLRTGLLFLSTLVGGGAQAQSPSTSMAPEPNVKNRGTPTALPPFQWTLSTGQLELRGALGVVSPGGSGSVTLAPSTSLSASIGLNDWFQVTLTHLLQPSATVRIGKREDGLQASFAAGINSLDLEGEAIGGFVSAGAGLQAGSNVWLIAGLSHEVTQSPTAGARPHSIARLGMALTPHPRVRLQFAVLARVDDLPTPGMMYLGLGSAIHSGGRSWPLIQWQLLPSLSLDGHARLWMGPTGSFLREGQVGFTWTSP